MNETTRVSRLKIFTFIYGFARPYLAALIVGTILYCSQMVMFPIISSALMGGVTEAITTGDISRLLNTGFNVFMLTILAMVLVFFGILLYVSSSLKTTQRLQVKILRSFICGGSNDHTHSGEKLSMLNNDVKTAENLYSNALAGVFFSLFPMFFLSVMIFILDWRIGLFTLFLGIFSTAGQVLFAKPIAKISKSNLETTASATKTIGDIFSGGIIARVFRLQERLLAIFGDDNDILRKLLFREANIDGARKLVSGISDVLTTGGIFIVGSILISRYDMTLATLMALVPLCTTVTASITNFGAAWAGMQGPFEAGRRINKLLDGDNHVDPLLKTQQLIPLEQNGGLSVDVNNLTYAYQGADAPVLADVNFSIKENQLVAFVGESGSGKSTLLKIIAGLYISEGIQISIGSKTLSYDDLTVWRSYFAYVDQNCTLFNLTVAENIGLGKEDSSFEEIKAAAIEADADEFIAALPQGYDTPVGEVGGLLSGGQRQRIAIARALIRRSPVLVLDEATSALDAESEREVNRTISHLRKDHTILMITHNLPAIEPDVVFHIENGRVEVRE